MNAAYTATSTVISNAALAEAIMANVPEVCGTYYKDLPVAMLEVHPTIQRDLSEHYLKIAENWNLDKCAPLTVSWKNDGTFLIIDGQHRYMAAKMNGVAMLPCRVFKNLSEEEEAKMFYTQNENNKRLTPRDTLKAKLVVHEETAEILKDLCGRYGVFLFKESPFDIPYLKALADMNNIIERWGERTAETIFRFVEMAGWHDDLNGYSTYVIRPIMTLWRKLYIKSGHEDPTMDVLAVAEVIHGMPLEQFVSAAVAMFPHSTQHMAVYELMRRIHDGNLDFSTCLLAENTWQNPLDKNKCL